MTARARLRQEMVNRGGPPLSERAAAKPLPWPFGPHVAGYK